jgi:hypothetical protein
MASGWHELTRLTGSADFHITRVSLKDSDISIEGAFELPPLAKLSYEDQVFVAAFVRSHGSIKQMEEAFGVSYPTIKSRLNRIAARLDFVKIRTGSDRDEILDRLEQGEISAKEAVERLKR